MKYLLLIVIQAYWRIIPGHKRRNCLYRISCSRHVYFVAKNKGLYAGLKAMIARYQTCRPNHEIVLLKKENALLIKLADGTILNEENISHNIVNQYKAKVITA